jgi:hypothetical protein
MTGILGIWWAHAMGRRRLATYLAAAVVATAVGVSGAARPAWFTFGARGG